MWPASRRSHPKQLPAPLRPFGRRLFISVTSTPSLRFPVPSPIIIPVFSAAGTVRHTLESVLSQEPAPAEVIVVDDGSTDDIREMLTPFFDVIRYLRKSNGGVASARNLGVRSARSEFISFLDADDYWLPGFLEKTVGFLIDHPSCGAVSTTHHRQTNAGRHRHPVAGLLPCTRLKTGEVGRFFLAYRRNMNRLRSTIAPRLLLWRGAQDPGNSILASGRETSLPPYPRERYRLRTS